MACAALALVSCAPGAEPEIPQQPDAPGEGYERRAPEGDSDADDVARAAVSRAAASIAHRIARAVDDVDATPLEAGSYRGHLMDVGSARM